MFVDVVFTHAEVEHIDVEKFGFIAVIDVLRATTTIVTALENGARGIVPVATPHEARELAATSGDVLLAGERGARIIPGFHLGNSPLEYVQSVVSGKLIALTTTNGTQAFQRVQRRSREADAVGEHRFDYAAGDPTSTDDGTDDPPTIVAACLRNAAAVAREMAASYEAGCTAGLLVCAGTEGRFSWDDTYCAALIVAKLSQLISIDIGDGARAAKRMLYGSMANGPSEISSPSAARPRSTPGTPGTGDSLNKIDRNLSADAFDELQASKHGRRLLDMGLYEDVKYCAETSVSDVVPRFVMGMLAREGTDGNVVNK